MRWRDAVLMNAQPHLRGVTLIIVVALLPSLGAAQDCGVDCVLERDKDAVLVIYLEVISCLLGPVYALFQGGIITLLGAGWLLTDLLVLRGIFVTVMPLVERKSRWKIDGEFVWGYVILSLMPGAWMALNWAVMCLWAHFHLH